MIFLPLIQTIGAVGVGVIIFDILRKKYQHYNHQTQIKRKWLAQTQKKQEELHEELSKEINDVLNQYTIFVNLFCHNKMSKTEENAILCEQVKRHIEQVHRRIMLWESSLVAYYNKIIDLTKINNKKESPAAEQFAGQLGNLVVPSNKSYFASELTLVGINIIQKSKELCGLMHNDHPLIHEKKKVFCQQTMKLLEEINSAYRSFEEQLELGFKEHLKNLDQFIVVPK